MKCKKILSALLAVVMLLSMMPTVFAADGAENANCTVVIQYLHEDGKPAANSWTASLAKGSNYQGTVNNPTVVGYEPKESTPVEEQSVTFTKEAVTLDIQNIQSNITITVTYGPAMVDYTVKYFQQNVNGDNYALVDTETLRGLTGSKVNVPSKSYEGFYELLYNKDAEIAADGSTVVEVYYDRNYYLMTFNLGGGYGVEPIYARYGTPIGVVGTPEKPGYIFQSWNAEIPANMPAGDVQYTAQWAPEASVPYTVVFWYENANDDGYSYAGSTTTSGAPETEVSSGSFQNTNFDGRDSTHFTYNPAKAETKTVVGDGSTVLNVYFTRNEYTLTFKNSNNQTYGTITAKYQADIADKWPTAGTTMSEGNSSNSTVPDNLYYWGFTPVGASKETLQATKIFTMTADVCKAGGMTFTAHTSNKLYNYTINYYMESLDGTGKEYNGRKFTKNGNFSQTLKYTNVNSWGYKSIDGFKPTSDNGELVGTREYNLYYTRNRHAITFLDNYGSEVASITEVMFEMPLKNVTYNGAAISGIVPDYPDGLEVGAYRFGGWYTTPQCFDGTEANFDTAIMPNANLAFYAKWVPVSHTVNVYMDSSMNVKVADAQTVLHGGFADPVGTPSNGQYTFVGWFYMDNGVEKAFDFASMPVRKDLDIYAKWSSNVLVPYTIYYQLKNGTPIADDTTGSALAGTTRTFDAKGGDALYTDYQEGYFPETKSHSLTLSIDDSTQNSFTFVYVEEEAVPYTVKYLEKGTDTELAPEKTVSNNRKAVVTEYAVSVTGYMPEQYQQRLIVTADGENVLIFYYVADTQHAMVTETHILVKNGVETQYSHSEYTGNIGETYTKSNLTNIDGYVFDYATVNGEKWMGNGDPSRALTYEGLHFVFYYKYNRFDVWYQSQNRTTTYDMVDSFSVTNRVHNGYLYGGLYTDQTFTKPLDEEICGLGFAPQAGRTYYVKEVSEAYLQPKIYYVYDKHDNNKVKQIYLVTAIDDMNYRQVGFDVNTYEHKQEAVSGATVYENITIQHYNNQWVIDPTLAEVKTLQDFFGNTLTNGYLNVQKYSDYKGNPTNLKQNYTMLPYFVTLDGVKVTGVKNREVLLGNGNYTGTSDGLHVNDTGVASTATKYEEPSANSLMLRSTFSLTWEQPAATEYTITKVDGETTTTQTVEAGNQTGQIAYAEKNGKLFAGWFMDNECTVPADFSDVQTDMTVYAKYISASSVNTNVTLLSKKDGGLKTTVTLNTDQFAEVGFAYSYNGEEGTVVAGDKVVKRPLLQWLTGRQTQYQFSGSWNLNGLKNRDTFTVTPYWVTLDGTIVYGAADTYVCYWNFILQ